MVGMALLLEKTETANIIFRRHTFLAYEIRSFQLVPNGNRIKDHFPALLIKKLCLKFHSKYLQSYRTKILLKIVEKCRFFNIKRRIFETSAILFQTKIAT